jgi:hypothetical protein
MWMHSLTGNELWFLLPFAINFVALAILDLAIRAGAATV